MPVIRLAGPADAQALAACVGAAFSHYIERMGGQVPGPMRADFAALIEGILDNLIDNAFRYGGRTITVELAGAVLSVIDDGPGIPPEAQRDLLQRWAQGPAGLQLGKGAGLGLSIMARYAQLLGAGFTLQNDAVTGGLRASVAFGQPGGAGAS